MCRLHFQAEKKLKVQLSTLEQQRSKTQGTLTEKEKELEKLRAQLKTAQGSFEEERKKMKAQVAELQESNVKKASRIFKIQTYCTYLTTQLHFLYLESRDKHCIATGLYLIHMFPKVRLFI